MGCDIHLYVEVRKNGKWESADKWQMSKWGGGYLNVEPEDQFYSESNYELFAVLAGVRNRYGITPIADPRGLPVDINKQLADYASRFLEHTPSWLTVRELMAHDWTQIVTISGHIELPKYVEWKVRQFKDQPDSWCAGYAGASRYDIPLKDADAIVEAVKEKRNWEDMKLAWESLDCKAMVHASWNRPLYRECADFLSECLPRLWRLGAPDDVRIVFWFDS